MYLDRLGGSGGWTLPPKLVDQPIGAERFVGVQQQHRQERPLLATDERDLVAVFESLDRAEDAEVHEGAVTTVWSGRYRFLG